MALRYCFEKERVMNTLWLSSRNDLAVVDTDGCEAVVICKFKKGKKWTS